MARVRSQFDTPEVLRQGYSEPERSRGGRDAEREGPGDTEEKVAPRLRTYPTGSACALRAPRLVGSCRRQLRDREGKGLRRRAARAAGARAPACPWRCCPGEGLRAGTAASPAPSREATAAAAAALWGPLAPSTSCIGASGAFRKRLAQVKGFFFVKSLAAACGPEPPHPTPGPSEAPAAAPPGLGWAGPGGGGVGSKQPAAGAACAAPAAPGDRGENLEKSLQLAESPVEARRALLRTGRGSRELLRRALSRFTS